jgi:hypothetical protein
VRKHKPVFGLGVLVIGDEDTGSIAGLSPARVGSLNQLLSTRLIFSESFPRRIYEKEPFYEF